MLYSPSYLKQFFNKKNVSNTLPYLHPTLDQSVWDLFEENSIHSALTGVHEKYSMVIENDELRLTQKGEQGAYILKPVIIGNQDLKKMDLMPINEHLTMQIARLVYQIPTAKNILVSFKHTNNTSISNIAYLTKRFDINAEGIAVRQEDFASLLGKTEIKDGENYKYQGSCCDLFKVLKAYTPNYGLGAINIFKLLIFNFLFSNGDAHLKNFSLQEKVVGEEDFFLTPAYDLLNTAIHIEDSFFALDEGLLPNRSAKGKFYDQFLHLAESVNISIEHTKHILNDFLNPNKRRRIKTLVDKSLLDEKTKRQYWQHYLTRCNRLAKKST